MNGAAFEQFKQVWLVDFEFGAPSGERPRPICLVAREYRSGQLIRQWLDDVSPRSLPFDLAPNCLYVAYYASAELGCHLALDWPMPVCVLDLFVEFRNRTNGQAIVCGNSLLGALAHFGLGAIDAADKQEMRELAMRGGRFTQQEQRDLLDYCQTDVDALARLLPAMLPNIDLPRALLRGRYMAAAARMEWYGVPIDAPRLCALRENWEHIKRRLIKAVDADFGVFVPTDQTILNPDSTFGQAVLQKALEWEIYPHELAETATYVWQREKELGGEFYQAKREARRITGLTPARISAWEDSYRDSSSWPRLDETARDVAGRFPELGLGQGYDSESAPDSTDYAGKLWELLRVEQDRPKPRHHRDILEEAAEIVFRKRTGEHHRPMSFNAERFAGWLACHNIPWPRLESGKLALDDETFRQMARRYPKVAPLRELRHTLGQLRLNDLAVGSDGRNRCLLSAFSSKTGRNQPSNSRFIFGPSAWLRFLIKPEPGRAVAYVDWCQQEFGIAAALSGDTAMMEAYESGDPYLAFAKQAGAVPADATKQSHPKERSQFKVCSLAVQYGMGAKSLAESLGEPEIVGRELLRMHRQTYPLFWKWSEAAVDYAMLYCRLQTVFGWNLHVSPDANPRSLSNFPCQANGSEMLRLACCLATERGIMVCAPIHDALLVEGPVDDIQTVVTETQRAMRKASKILLGGFSLRTDSEIVAYPARYTDERGVKMWEVVTGILEELNDEPVGDLSNPLPTTWAMGCTPLGQWAAYLSNLIIYLITTVRLKVE